MPNIELTYSSLETYIAKLNAIDGNYDAALAEIKKSTDLGSDLCQAVWHFQSKDKAYDTLETIKKKISTVKQSNQELKSFIRGIDDLYDKSNNRQFTKNFDWNSSIFRINNYIPAFLISPPVFVIAVNIWGAKKIMSLFNNNKAKTPDTKAVSSTI